MIIIPAIDIKNGKVVRLTQGKFDEVTIYSSDPLSIAKKWQASGAKCLHIIDLDGAEKGEIQNFDIITTIAKTIDIPVQMGGGIRTKDDIRRLLLNGISRVIVGTKVVEDQNFFVDILSQWGDKISISLDCTRGIVTKKGWTEMSNLKATDFAKKLERLGLQNIIYTDIARDGMLSGPNIKGIKDILSAINISVVASGGISGLEDIVNLKELKSHGLAGVIVGKALYENKFYLRDAIEICSRKE